MKSFLLKVKMSIRMAVWSYKHPDTLNESIFIMLGQLLEFIFKVSIEQKPYMTSVLIKCDDEKKEIVSLWAGAGIGAEPIKRIQELKEENELLKLELYKKLDGELKDTIDVND